MYIRTFTQACDSIKTCRSFNYIFNVEEKNQCSLYWLACKWYQLNPDNYYRSYDKIASSTSALSP